MWGFHASPRADPPTLTYGLSTSIDGIRALYLIAIAWRRPLTYSLEKLINLQT